MAADPPTHLDREEGVALGLAWFPAADYARAIELWPSIAEDWADTPHDEYCRHFERHLREYADVVAPKAIAVAPIRIDHYVAWCDAAGIDPEEGRARYAAEVMYRGAGIPWPPARNEPCWCGSGRKYKRCCGAT